MKNDFHHKVVCTHWKHCFICDKNEQCVYKFNMSMDHEI